MSKKCRKSGVIALALALLMLISVLPLGAFADSSAVTNVTYIEQDGKIIFSVTTAAGIYNRVKVSSADNPSGSLAVGDSYTDNGDGTVTWTVRTNEPDSDAVFAFDARRASDSKYTKTFYTLDYVKEVQPAAPVTNVTYVEQDGKIIFSVTTAAGIYNRVKASSADNPSGSLAVGDSYTDNGDGTVTWTVRVNAPGADASYVFDARKSEDGKYTKIYYTLDYAATPEPIQVITGVSYNVDSGKIFFSVTTSADYDRVAVYLTSNTSAALSTSYSSVVNGDGTVTWLVKLADPKEVTSYSFDARSAETGKYSKIYYEVVYKPVSVPVKSVSQEVKDGKLYLYVTTDSDIYNRAKVSSPDNPSGSIAVSKSSAPAETEGRTVWTIVLTAPEKATDYLLDMRDAQTGKYVKVYFGYTYTPAFSPEEQSPFKSVSSEFIADCVIFTVETDDSFNRVKISLTSNLSGYVKYTDSYTELQNGNRLWILKTDAPAEDTLYALDGRLDATGRYLKNYFYFNLLVPTQTEPTVKSITCSAADGKLVFRAVTNDSYNRVKVSLAGEKAHLAYTDKFTSLTNGDREWTLTVDEPKETSTYVFDARIIATGRYTGEGEEYTYTVESVITEGSIESVTVNTGVYEIGVVVKTAEGCEKIAVQYTENGESVSAESLEYALDASGSRIFTVALSVPSGDAVITVTSFDCASEIEGRVSVNYYAAGDMEHEVI